MTSKKLDREQIEQRLRVVDECSRSGMSSGQFAQLQGLSAAQLRGWQAHAPRWRAVLAGTPYVKPVVLAARGFVQAHAPGPSQACEAVGTHVRIECRQGSRSAVLHWPVASPLECAQWLGAWLT